MDRFLLRIYSQYLSNEEEMRVISEIDAIDAPNIKQVVTVNEIMELRELTKQVHVSPDIIEYITSIVHTIRTNPDVIYGLSTRSGISIFKCARVFAILDGREYVIPDDVKRLAYFTIEHRLRIRPEAEMDDVTPRMIINKTLDSIPVPRFDI
jgi:MoxR-like ATPase